MKSKKTNRFEKDFKPFLQLLQAMKYDPVINTRVVAALKLDSYHRRIVLNNWLEQLRLSMAPGKLTQTLSYLFDDNIAEKVYDLIKRSKKKRENFD